MKRKYTKEEVKKYYQEIGKFLNQKFHNALKEILKSRRFQELIKVKRLLYNYSIPNTILILAQRPDLLHKSQLILPKYKWKKLGRQIKKGAKGIWIWRPNPKKVVIERVITNEKGEPEIDENHEIKMEKEIVEKMYFKPEKIYTEDETFGKKLPDLRYRHLKGNDLKRIYELIRVSSPIPVMELEGNRENYRYAGRYNMNDGTIMIVKDYDYNSKLSTLIHELSHAIRHREGLMKKDRNFEEAVVETAAISLLTKMGVEDAVQYRGEYVLSFLNIQNEKELNERARDLFKEAEETVRILLEKIPAIQTAISEVSKDFIDYERVMEEEVRGREEVEIE